MRLLWSDFKANQPRVLAWFCGLLLLVQFANVITYIADNTDNQGVVIARDDDSGWGIMKAIKTRWWKDNGWAHYGPAYFRPAHSLNYFLGQTANPRAEGETQSWERTAHFSILLLAVLSVYGSMLLLASILTASWPHRFAFTALLTALAFSDLTWAEFIFRAHPDHLFALVCAVSFYWTLRYLAAPDNRRYFVGSALLWGVAGATKLSLGLVAPAFVLLFVPPFRRERWILGLKYLGYIFLGYFIIGFPQSITLMRPIRFLLTQSQLSFPPDTESVQTWLRLFFDQSWKIILALLAFAWLMPQAKQVTRLSRRDWVRVSLILIFPFLMMLKRKLTIPFSHYPFPFLMMSFVALSVYLARAKRMAWTANPWTSFLAIGVMVVSVGTSPDALNIQLQAQMKCRPENRELQRKMIQWGEEENKIWVDPYVPYDTSLPKSQQDVSWSKSWREAESEGYTLFAFNTGYYKQFLGEGEPSEYTRLETPGWPAAREFYRSFLDHDEAVSPSGRKFIKVFTDECSHEVWKLAP